MNAFACQETLATDVNHLYRVARVYQFLLHASKLDQALMKTCQSVQSDLHTSIMKRYGVRTGYYLIMAVFCEVSPNFPLASHTCLLQIPHPIAVIAREELHRLTQHENACLTRT